MSDSGKRQLYASLAGVTLANQNTNHLITLACENVAGSSTGNVNQDLRDLANAASDTGLDYDNVNHATNQWAVMRGFNSFSQMDGTAIAGYDVFLCYGQSYWTSCFGLDPDIDKMIPRVKQWGFYGGENNKIRPSYPPFEHSDAHAGEIGPELAFAEAYIADGALAAGRQLLLVPAAFDGTSFVGNNWNPGDGRYNSAKALINAAMGTANSTLKGFLFLQGPSDRTSTGATYQTALLAHIDAVRGGTEIPSAGATTPFVMCGMVQEWLDEGGDNRDQIQAVLHSLPTLRNYTGFADISDLTKTLDVADTIHPDAPMARILGARLYTAYKEALANTP